MPDEAVAEQNLDKVTVLYKYPSCVVTHSAIRRPGLEAIIHQPARRTGIAARRYRLVCTSLYVSGSQAIATGERFHLPLIEKHKAQAGSAAACLRGN